MDNKKPKRSEVWDVYIRIFHWLLTICVLTSFISIEFFGSLKVHFISGYCIVGMLVFRLAWGVFGSETARFVNFIKGPTAIIDYVSSLGDAKRYKAAYGHSPVAALAVVAMLLILIFQVFSGLFFFDDETFVEGPLAPYGSDALLGNAKFYHPIGSKLVLAIIAGHLLAIAVYYIFFKENLISPMVKGWRPSAADKVLKVRHAVAIVCIICAACVVGYIIYG